MPWKQWARLEEVLSDDLNLAVRQAVIRFPTIAARDAAIAAPEDGQMAWTADTRQTLEWNEPLKQWTPPWGVAWGRVKHVKRDGNDQQIGNGARDIPGFAVAVDMLKGRRYACGLHIPRMQQSAPGEISTYLSVDVTTLTNATYAGGGNDIYGPHIETTWDETTGGTRTVKGSLSSNGPTNSAFGPMFLWVDDMGPIR